MYGGESDVVRVFDDKLRLTNKDLEEYLKQADLENYGFKKSIEFSTTTDENGKTTTKKTIYYKVTCDCSKVFVWEAILEQRLPKKMKQSDIISITQKEVNKRLVGRKTKNCIVALEIHPNKCLAKKPGNSISKRAAGWCGVCGTCSAVTINYDD